jgi:hypothetical protein
MAGLEKNSLWSDIRNNPNAALDRVLGPSYDYTQGVQSPQQLGVSDEGSMGQVFTNANAVKSYTQQLITGPLLGNTTFVETGGMCRAPYGGIIPRWSFIDNRMGLSDAVAALPAAGGLTNALGGLADEFNGIVPGMMGDIAALNPIKPINGLVLDGIPPCFAVTCPVTDVQGNNPNNESHFITPALEVNLRKCKAAKNQKYLEDQEVKKIASTKSKFGNQFIDEDYMDFTSKPYKPIASTDLTPYVYWGIAIAIFCGVFIKKI